RFHGQDHEKGMEFRRASDVCGSRQCLDLLCGYVWISGVEIHRMEKMRRRPLDESVCVIGDRSGRRIVHMLEDCIEHRPSMLGQISHQLAEFPVEVAKK